MAFGLGKPILAMIAIATAGAAWMAVRRDQPPTDLRLWVFAGPQFNHYNDDLRRPFQQVFGKSLEVDLIPARAMDMRLPVLFMSPGKSQEMPDAAEIEIGSVGRYLRPPVDEVGFLPLNSYLQSSGFRQIASLDAPGQPGWTARLTTDGKLYTFIDHHWQLNPNRSRPDAWIDRILPSRLATASKNGQIFAIPHDVHPTALAFREDLFREAGVDLIDAAGKSTVATWPDFQKKCLQFQLYWRQHGFPHRHAIELPEANAGMLSIMLLQRHINLIDADNHIHLNDPKTAQTLAFYVQLVAGDRKIGAEAAAESGLEYNDLAEGNLCALFAPDWRIEFLKKYVPALAGKLRVIPLPRFDPADAPTASYGGTLIAIPRGCAHPDDAWNLIEYFYFSPAGLADRENLGILPPLPEEWDKPQYGQGDPFFGNQKVLELYSDLARQAPPIAITPVTGIALGTLSYVQSKAVGYTRSHGPVGLENQCQRWLDEAAVDLQRRIDHARF